MPFLSYTTFTILALVTLVAGSFWSLRRLGFNRVKILTLIFITATSTVIGARLLHVLTNPSIYQKDPRLIWDLSAHGFSLFGGLMMACALGLIIAALLKLPLLKLADYTAPWVGLGMAVMRVGCFIHGCCFGLVTSLPWGVRFPLMSPAHLYQLSQPGAKLMEVQLVHPTQLYELGVALVASILAFWSLKRKLPSGMAAATFVAAFTVGRWGIFYLRAPDRDFVGPSFFYPGMYALIIMISSCFFLPFLKGYTLGKIKSN